MLEHPLITRVNRTGYPDGVENTISQPEHAGFDYFDEEVLVGDSIILMPNGEMVLEDNLEDYLIEILGFKYTTAE